MSSTRSGILSSLLLILVACGGLPAPRGPQAAAPSLHAQAGGAGITLELNRWVSFQVTTPGYTDRSLRHMFSLARTDVINAGSDPTSRADATFRVVPALDGTPCYSFQSYNYPDRYLRHSNFRLRIDPNDGTQLMHEDATFCAQTGFGVNGGVSLVSRNFPGYYIRHVNAEVWIGKSGASGNARDSASSYDNDISWNLATAWAGGCSAVTWQRGVNYPVGTVVLFAGNGQYYKEINAGTNGSDGTDPTVSTWYWQPTTCDTGTPPPPPGGFVVSEAQYNQMFPNRVAYYNYPGLTAALGAWPAFATTGTDTVKRQEAAAFLANMHHESGGGLYVREQNQANWNSYCSSGNCGGRQYYGRGPIQLSWDFNYRAAGDALGLDLLNNPDLVATDPTVGWKTALWYWMTQRAQAAQTSHDAMLNGRGFGETIRAINGGIECGATGLGHDEMQHRVNLYQNFVTILGVPAGSNVTC